MKRAIIYIIHEFPPVTQTFVITELTAVRELNEHTRAYALRHESRSRTDEAKTIWFAATACHVAMIPHLLAVCGRLLARAPQVTRLMNIRARGVSNYLRQVKALLHAIALTALLRRHKVSDAHLHAHFLGRTLDVLSYARLLGAGTSTSATGHAADLTSPASPRRLSAQLKNLDFLVCASEYVKSHSACPNVMPATAIVHAAVEEQGVARDLFKEPYLRITSIGRLVEKKGFDTVVAAARHLQAHHVPFTWTVIGDGPLREHLTAESADLVKAGLLDWRGHLAHDEVLSVLAHDTDVLVQPCRKAENGDIDGIPVVLMEAMRMGIAVITTPVAGIPELVKSGETGFLHPIGDDAALASRIVELSENEALAREVGRAGRRYVMANFDSRGEAAKLVKAIATVKA